MSNFLFLVNVGDGIVSSVLITKLVPNRRFTSSQYCDFKLAVYTQAESSIIWEKIDEVKFDGNNNSQLKSSDYNLAIGQIAVVIPCGIHERLEKNSFRLPEPITRKVDTSPVSERATISFERGDSFSSYQGDYPFQMTKAKGTFLCFDSLIFQPEKDVINKLVFINIFSQELKEKNKFTLNMANAVSKENIKKQKYVHNSAAILNVEFKSDLSTVFYSKDSIGIPIFISFHKDLNSNLSVEHSHPPSEFFYGECRFAGQKELKMNWLSVLP